MTFLGCQLDYTWNELPFRAHLYSDLEAGRHRILIWNLKQDDRYLNPGFEARRHTFNLCHTFCWKLINKDKGRKKDLLFTLACLPHLVCTSIVSLALEPTSL